MTSKTTGLLNRITSANGLDDKTKRNDLIRQAHEQGVSVKAIADALGFSLSGVRRLLTPTASTPYIRQFDKGVKSAKAEALALLDRPDALDAIREWATA